MESLVARCLTDPGFLNWAVQTPEMVYSKAGENIRSSAVKLDFRKLQQFSGFISKVQHNYLWEHFPATRRLLWRSGIEHEVFAAYRTIQIGDQLRNADRSARILRFCDFLKDFARESAHDLLLCVLAHEKCLWELRRSNSRRGQPLTPGNSEIENWKCFERRVPHLAPYVRFSIFECDPLEALEMALQGELRIRATQRKQIALLYCLGSTDSIRLLRLDSVSARVYAEIGFHRSVRNIASRIRHSGLAWIPPSALRPAFQDGITAGFLVWEGVPCA